MIELISEMFSYTFMTRAFVSGLLLSLCASLLGTPLVLKRYSMIGDGLSHVGFGSLGRTMGRVDLVVVRIRRFLLPFPSMRVG